MNSIRHDLRGHKSLEDLQQWRQEEEQDRKESLDSIPHPYICETSHNQESDKTP